MLAAEMDCTDEARKWFREGTRTVMVSQGEEHTAAAAVRWQGRAGCLGCLPANKPVLRLFLHLWLIARFSM